jgi:hypothetical protein
MHVRTIQALWRGVWAARARRFGEAVAWFNIADDCAVWRRRRTLWNLDAALRFMIRTYRESWQEPTLEPLLEMEGLLLSQPDRPDHSRRLFDRLWTSWCVRAHKTDTAWAYQTEMR